MRVIRLLHLRAGIYITLVALLARCGHTRAASHSEAPDRTAAKPLVLVDQGHHNFGKMDDVFTSWLEASGYRLKTLSGPFDEAILAAVDILIVRNPTNAVNVDNFRLPTPSAFSKQEIETLVAWVEHGGGLVLIIEHMPWAGAMQELASAFNVQVTNGFVIQGRALNDVVPAYKDSAAGVFVYRRNEGSLSSHLVTDGRTPAERLDSLVTNWGTALRLPPGAISLLTLDSTALSLEPREAWRFPQGTPVSSVAGWSQAGLLSRGQGRVVLLGDSFLVFAPGHIRPGTLAERGSQNPQFTLNVLRWVSQSPLGGSPRVN
jgi:hypothetical protein